MSSFHSVSFARRSSESTNHPEHRHSSSSENDFPATRNTCSFSMLRSLWADAHLSLRKRSIPQYSSNFHCPHILCQPFSFPNLLTPSAPLSQEQGVPIHSQIYPPISPGGNLRRHFSTFASNMVSQRRRSAQALLTRLTFYSGCSVTFLLSLLVTNHSLLIIRFCSTKVVNSTRLCSGGPNRLPRNLNRIFPKIYCLSKIERLGGIHSLGRS